MRLIYIFMVSIVTTLHASSSAILDPNDVKFTTKNVESPDSSDAAYVAGRILRGTDGNVNREQERKILLKRKHKRHYYKPSHAHDSAGSEAFHSAKKALKSSIRATKARLVPPYQRR
uniref:Secreted RxLR effector protein 9 n=2 Tax=Plasmopara viticola TaxID=143451 RepID=RLR9_PLAVT|nr:RecName: Full=Secreted RxLR effector protein 9; Flags: Precursor [Plasmopara viticola]ANC73369.1 secreted RxLR effector peptide protein 9 [Plasmopara viticola]QGU18293.1 putative RxLR effector [Plasmopara viticola]